MLQIFCLWDLREELLKGFVVVLEALIQRGKDKKHERVFCGEFELWMKSKLTLGSKSPSGRSKAFSSTAEDLINRVIHVTQSIYLHTHTNAHTRAHTHAIARTRNREHMRTQSHTQTITHAHSVTPTQDGTHTHAITHTNEHTHKRTQCKSVMMSHLLLWSRTSRCVSPRFWKDFPSEDLLHVLLLDFTETELISTWFLQKQTQYPQYTHIHTCYFRELNLTLIAWKCISKCCNRK